VCGLRKCFVLTISAREQLILLPWLEAIAKPSADVAVGLGLRDPTNLFDVKPP
jgi:hypothetical protein